MICLPKFFLIKENLLMKMWFVSTVLVIFLANIASGSNHALDNLYVMYPPDPNIRLVTKCFENLGCFSNGPPWYHPIYRPVSVAPADDVTTRFLLFTRLNVNNSYDLKPNKISLLNSPYVGKQQTKVLIHGYESNLKELLGIKDELLKYGDFSVIMVDWHHYNQAPVHQAIANGRVMAAQTAHLLLFLMLERGLEAGDIHVIGHSLGAQLAGLVGERIKNMGRITALDPIIQYFENSPRSVHVEYTDAVYVDVFHTTAGSDLYEGMGIVEAVGHADFYPNGGKHMTGCDMKRFLHSPATGNQFGNLCSHKRAFHYFQSSINMCEYTAYACFAYDAFKEGLCHNKKYSNIMGFHSRKPSVPMKYYIDTDKSFPYCEVNQIQNIDPINLAKNIYYTEK